jgi:predicted nucleotidyltransferase
VRHHEQAIERFVARTSRRPQALGLALTGSLARGEERVDSDIDLVLVVDEPSWTAAVRADRIMYTETDGVGYEHGYYDVKLATVAQLAAAADRGDDAVRDSLAAAKVLMDKGIDLERLLRGVAAVPEARWQDLAASQLAQARLHGEYFLAQGLDHADPLLTAHAAVHLAVAAARTLLALGHVRHPGAKQLLERIRALPDAPAGFADTLSTLVTAPTAAVAAAVLTATEAAAGGLLPASATLSRFVLDNELAWFTRVPPPEYR